MKVFITVEELTLSLNELKNQGKTIGLVPTMGALHQGHIKLIKTAQLYCDVVVCSIFVNPKQFNDAGDFEKYPRTVADDLEQLKAANCSFAFVPSKDEIYPKNFTSTTYKNLGLFAILEGEFRPGHFEGVVTVVLRLLEICAPSHAFFGLKDYQQYLVIKTAVRDLSLPISIKGVPTEREASGLAMSSRNRLLNTAEREQASAIYRILSEASLKKKTPQQTEKDAFKELQEAGLTPEYFKICNAENLAHIENWNEASDYVAVTAAKLNNVRLIDNLIF